ncbi:MAG: ABC transporter ATP-binding protein [Flavobacteriales bacterium]|nr:ABC transporter ATP-binding protein [Flavobacteriales bacterium]
MLALNGIDLSFDRVILKNVDFQINANEIVGVVGKSGAGKSSLLKIIAGISAPDNGTIWMNEKRMPNANSLLIPGFPEIAMVNQDFKLDPYHTVEENIREAVLSLPIMERDKRVTNLLRIFELQKIAKSKAYLISGGEQQRLAIARAIAKKPRLLILDEPFGHLDGFLRQKMSDFLVRIREEEKLSILLVSHDGQDVLGLCDSICFLQNAKLSKKKKAEKVYYDCSNLSLARLFGPVNKIELDGKMCCFRPDEYELSNENGIAVTFQRSVFAGAYYLNYFLDTKGTSIVLYGLTTLNGINSFRIKRKFN